MNVVTGSHLVEEVAGAFEQVFRNGADHDGLTGIRYKSGDRRPTPSGSPGPIGGSPKSIGLSPIDFRSRR